MHDGRSYPRPHSGYPSADWASLTEPVVRDLLGEPNPRLSRPNRGELRYGTRGSLVVKIPPHSRAGQWYDFEAGTGGGLISLVEHIQGTPRAEAISWLRDRGHVDSSYTRPPAPGSSVVQTGERRLRQGNSRQERQAEALRILARRLWAASEPLPIATESPAGRWRDHRKIGRPGMPWPADLRWIPVEVLHRGWQISPDVAGAIVAPLAAVADWMDSWPTPPEPVAIHLVAIDKQGNKALAWAGRDKTRLNLRTDIARAPAWVIGASPEGLDQAVVVEGVADALGVASRVDATVISTTNLSAMQGAAGNGLGQDLSRWTHAMIYADDDRKPDRKGAPPGLRGGTSLRRAIQAAGGTAEVRHLPGGKDAADWAAANPFLPLDEDAFAKYAQTLRDMYPAWPRWEVARRASIETTTKLGDLHDHSP